MLNPADNLTARCSHIAIPELLQQQQITDRASISHLQHTSQPLTTTGLFA
jgi:hypothetical protein